MPVVASDRWCYTHLEISRESVENVDDDDIDFADAIVL